MAHNDGLKLTIAKYYTPSGKCIDGVGITPDVEIKSTVAPHPMYDLDLNAYDDPQLAKAEELLEHQVDAGKIFFDDDFWKASNEVL